MSSSTSRVYRNEGTFKWWYNLLPLYCTTFFFQHAPGKIIWHEEEMHGAKLEPLFPG
jgi:hypothetical protein